MKAIIFLLILIFLVIGFTAERTEGDNTAKVRSQVSYSINKSQTQP